MNNFIDKFVEKSSKLANQIHLRSMRDSVALTMPLAILAGIMVLLNSLILDPNGVLSSIINTNTLVKAQEVGTHVTNGTLGIWAVASTVGVAYCLSKNKGAEEPLIPGFVALCSFVTLVPLTTSVTPLGGSEAVGIANILAQTYTGVSGMFTGLVVGITATELFLVISKIKALRIKMPESVPPMVAKSFDNMIPFMLVVVFYAVLSFVLDCFFGQSFNELVVNIIQQPIKGLTTSLPGFLIAMVIFNLLFAIGIHPSAIVDTVIGPGLLLAITENMDAVQAGLPAQNIINDSFKQVYGLIGGTGCTICLIIAVFAFSKRRDHKMIASLGVAPGIFNINEPVIFGFPIVMNPIMIIPFVLVTQINFILAYIVTSLGLIEKCVVQIPWTTPPVISAFLSTNGDIRAAVFHIILIVIGVMIYLPFLKMSEKSLNNQIEEN